MKFTLMSDLHLEFDGHNTIDTTNPEQADVLVLAGDIFVAEDLRRWTREDVQLPHESKREIAAVRYREFLNAVAQNYKYAIYVAGNHEFYHGKFRETLEVLRNECILNYNNVYFLENGYVDIEDVRFVGGTLWTDCNNQDPVTVLALQYGMNDYRTITNDECGYTKLRPVHTMFRHTNTLKYIQDNITSKTVVVTHHAPSFQSVDPKYAGEGELNGGYASNLEEFILDHPQIAFWCHGHMHGEFDYVVGDYTRVVCNPRGYPGQNPTWQPKTFEV